MLEGLHKFRFAKPDRVFLALNYVNYVHPLKMNSEIGLASISMTNPSYISSFMLHALLERLFAYLQYRNSFSYAHCLLEMGGAKHDYFSSLNLPTGVYYFINAGESL